MTQEFGFIHGIPETEYRGLESQREKDDKGKTWPEEQRQEPEGKGRRLGGKRSGGKLSAREKESGEQGEETLNEANDPFVIIFIRPLLFPATTFLCREK